MFWKKKRINRGEGLPGGLSAEAQPPGLPRSPAFSPRYPFLSPTAQPADQPSRRPKPHAPLIPLSLLSTLTASRAPHVGRLHLLPLAVNQPDTAGSKTKSRFPRGYCLMRPIDPLKKPGNPPCDLLSRLAQLGSPNCPVSPCFRSRRACSLPPSWSLLNRCSVGEIKTVPSFASR